MECKSWGGEIVGSVRVGEVGGGGERVESVRVGSERVGVSEWGQ